MSHVQLRSRLRLNVKMRLGTLKTLAKELVHGIKELLVQDLPRPIVEPHPYPLDLSVRQPSASRAFGNELPQQPGHDNHTLYTIFSSLWYSAAQPMASALHHLMKQIRLSIPAIVSVVCLLASACATTPKVVDTVLTDGPRGAVSLQSVEDSWFKTAHPLFVSPVLLTHMLRGVEIQVLPDDKTTAARVFSDKDTEFLSPLISTALSKAAKDQLVGFRVSHGTDAESDTTGGVLYVQGRLLHLALTHYRANLNPDGKLDRQSRNPRGLEPGQIRFVPETVRRSSLNEQPDLLNPPPLATLIIDYQSLARSVESQSAPGQSQPLYSDDTAVPHQDAQSILPTSGTAPSRETPDAYTEESRVVKELVMQHAIELDALKEDVRALQHRLAEIESDAQKMTKRKSASPLRKSVP